MHFINENRQGNLLIRIRALARAQTYPRSLAGMTIYRPRAHACYSEIRAIYSYTLYPLSAN